ncbi:MAG: hypothetical protein WC337_10630, partial [Candidatus Muiribacteriota bacterium]
MLEITNGKFDKELLNNIEFLKELDFFPKNPNYFRISKAYRETEFFLLSFLESKINNKEVFNFNKNKIDMMNLFLMNQKSEKISKFII